LAIPPDTYSPDVLEVTEGDNVTIHFYNLDTTDRHTFTMGAPYNINEDLLPGTNATFTFKAADEGVFRFYCTYHQPTMSGQLVVLPRPTVEKNQTTAVTVKQSMIKQKCQRSIYHFYRGHIREKATTQYYHACFFVWIKCN